MGHAFTRSSGWLAQAPSVRGGWRKLPLEPARNRACFNARVANSALLGTNSRRKSPSVVYHPLPPTSPLLHQEREAKEQQELNELADTDPAEYDRRIKKWYKRKMDGRDASSGGLDIGAGGDQERSGELDRRKSLARERRDAR